MKKLLLATTLLAGMGTISVQADTCKIDYTNGSTTLNIDTNQACAELGSIGNSTNLETLYDQIVSDIATQIGGGVDQSVLDNIQTELDRLDKEDHRLVGAVVTESDDGNTVIKFTTEDYKVNAESGSGAIKTFEMDVSSLDQSQELSDLADDVYENIDNQIIRDSAQDVRMDGMDAFVQEQQLYNTSFSNSINSNTSRINSLENKTEELTKGVAMAGAFAMGAGMHTLDHDNRWVIMPSLAHYEGETALAVQLQVAFTDHLSARFGYANSVSDMKDFDKGLVGGAVALSF